MIDAHYQSMTIRNCRDIAAWQRCVLFERKKIAALADKTSPSANCETAAPMFDKRTGPALRSMGQGRMWDFADGQGRLGMGCQPALLLRSGRVGAPAADIGRSRFGANGR